MFVQHWSRCLLLTWSFVFKFPVKSADFYSTGDILALGTTVGRYGSMFYKKLKIFFNTVYHLKIFWPVWLCFTDGLSCHATLVCILLHFKMEQSLCLIWNMQKVNCITCILEMQKHAFLMQRNVHAYISSLQKWCIGNLRMQGLALCTLDQVAWVWTLARSLCCVKQDLLLSQCLSPPWCINLLDATLWTYSATSILSRGA